MSLNSFFQPTPTPPPQGVEPTGFNLIRDMLMRKIFGLEANPYGLSGQTAAHPMQGQGGAQPFFSTGLNMSAPALSGSFPTAQTSGSAGAPQGNFNPAFSQLGGVHRDAGPVAGGPRAGQRVPLQAVLSMLTQRMPQRPPQQHFDGGNNPLYGNGQFQQAMGGVGNLNQMLGPGWETANLGPQLNLPGFQFTGAQHEFGGNPWIANAAAGAGWSPHMLAQWIAQGQQHRLASQGVVPGQRPQQTVPTAANNFGMPAGWNAGSRQGQPITHAPGWQPPSVAAGTHVNPAPLATGTPGNGQNTGIGNQQAAGNKTTMAAPTPSEGLSDPNAHQTMTIPGQG